MPDEFPKTPPVRIRVLLADDHAIFRQGIARLLQSEPDMEVIEFTASDGLMAVELAQRTKPDVIIMDVNMPGISGIEATRRIVRALPGVRVIGLSMELPRAAADDMRRAGAVAFLTKNCLAQDLLATIRSCKPGT